MTSQGAIVSLVNRDGFGAYRLWIICLQPARGIATLNSGILPQAELNSTKSGAAHKCEFVGRKLILEIRLFRKAVETITDFGF